MSRELAVGVVCGLMVGAWLSLARAMTSVQMTVVVRDPPTCPTVSAHTRSRRERASGRDPLPSTPSSVLRGMPRRRVVRRED